MTWQRILFVDFIQQLILPERNGAKSDGPILGFSGGKLGMAWESDTYPGILLIYLRMNGLKGGLSKGSMSMKKVGIHAEGGEDDRGMVNEEGHESLKWFMTKMAGMLRLRSTNPDELVSKGDLQVFKKFISDPEHKRLIVHRQSDGDEKIVITFTIPRSSGRRSIFFLKQRTFAVEEDGTLSGLLIGDIPNDLLENMSTLAHEVLYPVLMAGQVKDTLVMSKDITEVFHRFMSQVYLTVGQTQGKTLLPLPPNEPKWEESAEQRNVKDKERMHVLESCVVTWTQQIKNVFRLEPPSYIHPGDLETGTAAEFIYWRNRATDLSFIDEQLKSSKVQQVLKALEMSKSTYEKPFQKLVSEVSLPFPDFEISCSDLKMVCVSWTVA